VLRLVFLVLLLFLTNKAQEIELGIGSAALIYPDYIGSKSTQSLLIAYPYISYKSDKLEISRRGIRTKLFNMKDLELDLSVGGSLPADSSDNKQREGMPDLDLIFEIGPKLIYTFYNTSQDQFSFELPVRMVYSTDFRAFDSHGYIISPEFFYRHTFFDKLSFILSSAALYGSESYHEYFYQVDPQYVTPSRKAYNAKAGHGGLRNKLVLAYAQKCWRGGVYISHYYLNDASFKNSPLVETKSATFMGMSLSYVFYTDDHFEF